MHRVLVRDGNMNRWSALCLSALLALCLLPDRLSAVTCDTTVASDDVIQTAVDAASSGSTVCVEPGTYTERIVLKSGVTLHGNELARTIIDGEGTGTVITAAQSSVLSNLVIRNGGTGLSLTGISAFTARNVILKGNSTGIAASSSTFTVSHAVIDRNTTGVDLKSSSSLTISHSILSNNTTDVLTETGSALSAGHDLIYNNGTTNHPADSSTFGEDPLFVDVSQNDYHLRTGSPAIDAGAGTDPDGTTADIGAYGGQEMDVIPFPVGNLASTRVSDTSLTVDWDFNTAYSVTGYKIYFDSDAGAPYGGTATEGVSPINAGNVDTYTLTGLASPATSAPGGLSSTPGNNKLLVQWKAVAGARGYKLHYGTASGTYSDVIDVGTSTSAVISGLTNNTTYYLAVAAYFETVYYLSVSAYDGDGNESRLVNETSVVLVPRQDGPLSAEITDFPEESISFPNLKDENKCFIATAAYGSGAESRVVMLRNFRDRFLMTNGPGRLLVRAYYAASPPLARLIETSEFRKAVARGLLFPFVAIATVLVEGRPSAAAAATAGVLLLAVAGMVLRRRKRSA